ncbi:FkbM family methyltransferase [Caballeronia sp. LZ050]|uniref:FkbM family methyltransferase n=1 Tax=unclassified Caballeronia TaxID=2646786 RepID=UPI00285F64DD|nr:FkbM family methyltransferase [Caballeronia sp. LZ050]MDR5853626.1 FkbM family methyltransferase [Caballeronia sp. LZ050]
MLARVDFIKLDVEGMELDVLRGPKESSSGARPSSSSKCSRATRNPSRRFLSSL